MKKTQLIMLIIGLLVVVGVVLAINKKPKNSNNQTQNTGPTVVEVNFDSKNPSFAAQTYQVAEGASVKLKVTSDIADELHFHGYDLHSDLESGKQGEIDFTADKTGRFEFELEDHKITLGVIEVYPK